MGKRKEISDEILERARIMRAAGRSWNAIGRECGFDGDVIRWRIDPDFVARHKAMHGGPVSMIVHQRFSHADIEVILRKVPPDTRSMQARFFGDPLPGRSALDKRNAQSRPGKPTVIHAIHSAA